MKKGTVIAILGLLMVAGAWLLPVQAVQPAAQSAVQAQPAHTTPAARSEQPAGQSCNSTLLAKLGLTPAHGGVCHRGYCKYMGTPEEGGLYCRFSGYGPGGCCEYHDCILDPNCIIAEICPSDACAGGC